MPGILAVRLLATAPDGAVNSPLVARVVLIVFAALLLTGCGGEKVVSPTGPVEGSLPKAAKGDPAAGKKVFNDSGCGGCHAFTPAGSSGAVGPNLDEALKGKSADFVEQSIKDPNAEIAKGFQPGVMPQDYGSQLTSQQIADLVAFLTQK
jgi:mono/diheme cytochrome c family protein